MSGKTIVVVGAASGMGLRSAERLISEGWTVWALDRSEEGLKKAIDQVSDADAYRPLVCDMTEPDSLRSAFQAISEHCDAIDALLVSAGVTIVGMLDEISLEKVDELINVNFKGPWLTIKQAIPLLEKHATPNEPSRVIVIGSVSGLRPKYGNGMYSATKAAVHVLTNVFASELAERGIIVNAIAPGTTDTPMMKETASQNSSSFSFSGESPLGRIGTTDDVADAVLFLLSEGSRYINGVVLPVDGGSRAAYVKK